ncbi:glycosyl hydrolase [Spirochaetia bacterium]|nr:glycosyl hydrolase [Spirochaetia bacterium]
MDKSISLILGFHFHIPDGYADDEYEQLYSGTIKPFLSTLFKFPKIPVILHFSGSLLYWIERHHGEFFMLLIDMLKRKQIEILTGGFYEPMMPLLPLKDRTGQIEMLTTYLRKQFGKRSLGCWIPAGSWEQINISTLSKYNINWTFLDEQHFTDVKLNTHAPCISEDRGKLLTIFPISRKMQTEIESAAAVTAINSIKNNCTKNDNHVLTVFPRMFNNGTSENNILEFLDLLTKNEEEIEVVLPSKIVKNQPPLQKAYFSGNSVKNFLVKYPEANNIYSKMGFVHSLVDQAHGDKIRKRRAQEELWKAQSYDLFCDEAHYLQNTQMPLPIGIHRSNIRAAAYQAIIEAERITRETKSFLPAITTFDFNFDGINEYVYQGNPVNCLIKRTGANIFELDYIPKPWNYLNTSLGHYAFSDIIAPPDFSIDDVRLNKFSACRIMAGETYDEIDIDRSHGKVSFKSVQQNKNIKFNEIEIQKYYHIKENCVNVRYILLNTGKTDVDFSFIPEINLSFYDGSEKNLRVKHSDTDDDIKNMRKRNNRSKILDTASGDSLLDDEVIIGLKNLQFEDLYNEAIVEIKFVENDGFWILHEKNNAHEKDPIQYQQTCVMSVRKISLKSGTHTDFQISLSICH